MKHKYKILLDADAQKVVIQEYGELDKEVLSLLCEESYDATALREAAAGGREPVIERLRTQNLYPPKAYAERMAEVVSSLLDADQSEPVELLFDDLELLNRDHRPTAMLDDIEEENEEIDDLLEGEFEEDYESDDPPIKNINSSIKIADDDPADMDDDA